MGFTKKQLSELICKHLENGLHDLMEIMLESLMVYIFMKSVVQVTGATSAVPVVQWAWTYIDFPHST